MGFSWQVYKQFVFPDKCILCGKLIQREMSHVENYFCEQCESGYLQNNGCQRCGKPYKVGTYCLGCKEVPDEIDHIRGLFPYIDFYKSSVLRWKYSGLRKYAKGYSQLMYETYFIKEKLAIDLLIPIPIAPKRLQKRGFNQAKDLANLLSHLSGVPVYDLFSRTDAPKPQSACEKSERKNNIRGTIKCNDFAFTGEGLTIGFVDDIYTTGSTVSACLEALDDRLSAKIHKVYVLTVCLGL